MAEATASATRRTRHRPIIRVFVSSTFSDFKRERDALQRYAFSELERRCLQNGFQFQAIDLRWGVSTEAGLDHRTMRICFEELRRSQEISPAPNFLILVGNRYGWRPLPEEISAYEFKTLVKAAQSGGEQGHPIAGAHGNSAERILNQWYRLDENVYLPNPDETDPDRAPLNYILQPRTQQLGDGRDYTLTDERPPKDTQDWRDIQQVLWNVINTAFPRAQLDQRFDGIDWARHATDVQDEVKPRRAVPQIVRFQGSATEQEIWAGAISAANAKEHVVALFREITSCDVCCHRSGVEDFFDLTPTGEIDTDAHSAQQALKEAVRNGLGDKAIIEWPQSQLTCANDELLVKASEKELQVCDKLVVETVWAIIEQQIHEWRKPTGQDSVVETGAEQLHPARELEIERDEHLRVAAEHAAHFVGRDDTGGPLEKIRSYLNNDSRTPFVVHGVSGCGKSALLAKAFEYVPPGKNHIIRFLGVTPKSSDLQSLLTNLCQHLGRDNGIEGPLSAEIHKLQQEFHRHLDAASDRGSVVLFLDALDQLTETDAAFDLHWLPGSSSNPLPEHVKIVVSCLADRDENGPAGKPGAALQRLGLSGDNMLKLDALSVDEAKTLLFDGWLKDAGRTFECKSPHSSDSNQETQRYLIEQRLASDKQCRQPLCLRLLFEEVRHWRSYDSNRTLYGPESSADYTNDDGSTNAHVAPTSNPHVDALLKQLIDRLSSRSNHGNLLVERALSYITAARQGLSETEILEVLFADREVRKGILKTSLRNNHRMPRRPKRIPMAIWSRLRSDLACYLTERAAPGGNVLTFYHQQVRKFTNWHFLKTDIKCRTHQRIADYFSAQDSWWAVPDSDDRVADSLLALRKANSRKATELPWQLLCVARELSKTIADGDAKHFDALSDPDDCEAASWMAAWGTVSSLLCDLDFLYAKIHAGLDTELRTDLLRALNDWPESAVTIPKQSCTDLHHARRRLTEFADFIRLKLHVLKEVGSDIWCVAFNSSVNGAVSATARSTIIARGCWLEDGHRPTTPPSGYVSLRDSNLGHTYQIGLADDGTFAIAKDSTRLFLWNTVTGSLLRRVDVGNMQFSLSANALHAVALDGNKLCVWDMRELQPSNLRFTLTANVHNASITDDGKTVMTLIDSQDANTLAQLWDVHAATCIHMRDFGDDKPSIVQISCDGEFALAWFKDRMIRWSLTKGAELTTASPTKDIQKIAVSPNLQLVGWWDGDQSILIQSIAEKKSATTRIPVSQKVHQLAFSGDSRTIAACFLGNGFAVFDVVSGRRQFETGCDAHHVKLNRDGTRALSATSETLLFGLDELRVWDLESEDISKTTAPKHLNPAQDVFMPQRLPMVVSAGHLPNLLASSSITRRHLWQVTLEAGQSTQAVSGDSHGLLLVTATGDVPAAKADDPTLAFIHAIKTGDDEARRTAMHKYCETTGKGVRINLLHSLTRSTLRCFHTHHFGHPCGTVLTPDCRRIIWGLRAAEQAPGSGALEIRETVDGRLLHHIPVPNASSLAVTPDGRVCIIAESDGSITFWSIETGRRVGHIDGIAEAIQQLCISRDGRMIACGTESGGIHVRMLRTGAAVVHLLGHSNRVTGLAFSADSSRLASSGDRQLRVWSLCNGKCDAVFTLDHPVWAISEFGPDGAIAVTTRGGTTEVFRMQLRESAVLHTTAFLPWRVDIVKIIVSSYARDLMGTSPQVRFVETQALESVLGEQALKELPGLAHPDMSSRSREFSFDEGEPLPGFFETDFIAVCPSCGAELRIAKELVDRIRAYSHDAQEELPCYYIHESAWNDESLLIRCHGCRDSIRLNPFLADGVGKIGAENVGTVIPQTLELERRLIENYDMKMPPSFHFGSPTSARWNSDPTGPLVSLTESGSPKNSSHTTRNEQLERESQESQASDIGSGKDDMKVTIGDILAAISILLMILFIGIPFIYLLWALISK